MSIIDKFLDVMRLNDDDYEFDNEDYDYDEEEDYEVKEKKPSRRERKKEEERSGVPLLFLCPEAAGRRLLSSSQTVYTGDY